MNIKWLFEGGVPGETYEDGVRRRSKGMFITMVVVLLSAALVELVFTLSNSIWLSMATALLSGMAFVKIGTPFDQPVTEPTRRGDKLLWLVLFTPVLVVLAGASIYEALYERSVFQAALLAGVFGAVFGGTFMLFFDAASRGRA